MPVQMTQTVSSTFTTSMTRFPEIIDLPICTIDVKNVNPNNKNPYKNPFFMKKIRIVKIR